MIFYRRDLESTLKEYAKFPAVAVLGPRQSGKTTLVRHTFKNHLFLSLDDPELHKLAHDDPKAFLRKYDNEQGIILDEFQNVPHLLPYLKVIIDENPRPGYFVLTGSQNFLANELITQSLAGRIGILTLLPFSLYELNHNNLMQESHPEDIMFRGGYPQVYVGNFQPKEVYRSYIQTYVERDVRQLIKVTNLYTFQKFLRLCAARIGQLLNFSDLASSCGISVATVHEWLSILESSYIIFLLRPYWENFNKRVTKTPKIYFYDTGLACLLLEIESEKTLALSPMYGHLFEGLLIADFFKQYFNQGLTAPLYFWRDKNGEVEVDCLIHKHAKLIPIEIKSSETYNQQFFAALTKWQNITKSLPQDSYVIYAGNLSFSGQQGNLLPWNQAGDLLKKL
jgi:predicted AAA+ superfamily ATPase